MTTYSDVSHHQAVTLPAYWALHDRMALKVTEGTGFTDDTFRERYRYAKDRGLPLKLYHFDRAKFDGAAQFDFFLDAIRAAGGPRPGLDLLCHDVEDTNDPNLAAGSAREFTNHAAGLGYSGCVYTGVWYANPHGITAGILHPSWRRLWLSDYGTTPDAQMRLPNGWVRSQVIARQFTSTASVPGVGSPADYNRVLAEWLGSAPTPTPVEDTLSAAEVKQILDAIGGVSDIVSVMARGDVPPGPHGSTHANLKDMSAALNAVRAAVGALSDDEAHILAAVQASDAAIEAAVAAVGAPGPGADPVVFARAVIAQLGAVFNPAPTP